MTLGLPKLRWLVIGAIVAGVWTMREDAKGPRPPERVPTWIERVAARKPEPPKPSAKAGRPANAKPIASGTVEKPIPPKPVTGKPARQTPAAVQEAALVLPKTVERPPPKPQKFATGSISRPDKPTFVQTKAKVFMRAQARQDAPIIATLAPRTVMRELARSGDWRLLMGDGRKGWVRADYVAKPTFLPRRPKLPLAEVKAATTAAQ